MTSRLRQRALRDPYYRALAQQGASDADLLDAGLFIDGLEWPAWEHPCWDVSIPTTPVGKLLAPLERLRPGDRPVVLVSTGSFSPVHRGHLSMMEAARETLEKEGHVVLGGYLSPSHDQYVSAKMAGAAALHVEHRITLLEEALADSTWLHVCPWEGRYAPVALNFTDVIWRLRDYLHYQLRLQLRSQLRHSQRQWASTCTNATNSAPDSAREGQSADHPIEVAYVFGSDNAAFLSAFVDDGLAVCVERAQCPVPAKVVAAVATHQKSALCSSSQPRLFLATASAYAQASSTQVRQGQSHWLPSTVAARYSELRTRVRRGVEPRDLYLLRQDTTHAVSDWGVEAQHAFRFEKRLQEVLAPYVREAGFELALLPVRSQQHLCSTWAKEHQVLSLDACVSAQGSIAVSRQFELSDGQVRSRVMVARPGHAPIDQQLSNLDTQAQWLVVDDDSSTGQTRQSIERLLQEAGIGVKGFRFLNEALLRQEGLDHRSVADVVDARDFLLGARDGGLVVRLPDSTIARAPYMLPFVNLAFRACLPAHRAWDLSLRLWGINEEWFDSLPVTLRVMDASSATRALLVGLGFPQEATLASVCRDMRSRLSACVTVP